MSMFTKPKMKEPVVSDNGQQLKSKWQGVIDHLNASHKHLSEAMNLLSMITFDLQKGADFILKYRDSLIQTIEASGGTVEQDSIEEQIKDFIPKNIRAPEAPPNE